MPCYKCSNGKWRIGAGKCIFDTKEKCLAGLRAYYANQDQEFPLGDIQVLSLIRDYLDGAIEVPENAQEELEMLINEFSERLLQLEDFWRD